MDASWSELLRFLNFPKKQGLIVAASKSSNLTLKKSALLVASEDYPALIIDDASIEKLFKTDKLLIYENYAMILARLSLRHPTYVKKVQDKLGIKLYSKKVKELRYTGVSGYNFSIGFNGL